MAAYQDPYRQPFKRYDDPRRILLEAQTWSSNAAEYAERGEVEQRTAAIFAQVAVARAIEGLAAAILATGGFDLGDGR